MELVRCRACGYIMKESKLRDLCPACGVPRTSFEPHRETLSKRRAFILDLNLHPIMLHFPQAFAAVIPPFILLGVALPAPAGGLLLDAARVMAVLLFPAALGAFACGLIDGTTRFRKLSTPALIRKTAAGSLLLALAGASAAVAAILGTGYPGRLYLLVIAAAALACQIYLAQIGKGLMCAKLPG